MNTTKLRLLYLIDLFKQDTNETNPVTMPDILDYLYEKGIVAERKSLYADIDTLKTWGLDILYIRPQGYYLASSDFDIIEIKLLVDAIASSDFLTKKKTIELQKKLLSCINHYDQKSIEHQLFQNPNKFKNENIFYSLDTIQSAINKNSSIQFMYFDITIDKQKKYRKDSTPYHLIPYALLYENQRYYCIGYSSKHNNFSHYRVDKMDQVISLDDFNEKKNFNLSRYKTTNFNMTLGQIENITLEFDLSLTNIVFDTFGQDVFIQKVSPTTFTINLSTTLSSNFIGWLLQFGKKVKVLSPSSLIEDIKRLIDEVQEVY